MAGRIEPLTETGIIADLLKSQRRNTGALAEIQIPQPAKDTFTVAATPVTTYQLAAIPYQGTGGSSLNFSLNGVELLEGVDYTCDYTTGLVTVSATLKGTPTPADVLSADYWTTGDLIAASSVADTGSSGNPANWVVASNRARLTTGSLSGHATGGHYAAYIPVGGYANDVQCVVAVGSSTIGEAGQLYVALADHGSGTIDGVWLNFKSTGDFLGYGYQGGTPTGSGALGTSTATAPWTLRATLSSAGVLACYQNGTLIGSKDIGTDDPTAWAAIAANCTAIGIGVGDSGNSVTASVFESFQTTSGSVVDSFNRADQSGLGNADTGQSWSYTP